MSRKLGIYIHIPFCVKKCDYCDFLSAPADGRTMDSYVEALKKEIHLSREKMTEYLIDTVFIGGGTPSILEGKLIVSILETLRKNCNLSAEAEITIECNPGTVTEEKLLLYRKAGINRISFGLQSVKDEELKSIGRIHDYSQFLESYHMARKCGFRNINIDLMSALPGQTIASYKETLGEVIALNPEHISAYSLIVEDGTKMEERVERAEKEGLNILPHEDEEREMYYLTKDMLNAAGYNRYEISNYAKKGMECKHNVGYWQRKDYLGFGIGAASLYKEERYNNVSDINIYMEKIRCMDSLEGEEVLNYNSKENVQKQLYNIEENRQKLSVKEQMEEFMFLGLRMMEGVSTRKFEIIFNMEYGKVYKEVTDKLVKEKLLLWTGENIRLTEKGIDISNYVMSEFL